MAVELLAVGGLVENVTAARGYKGRGTGRSNT